MKKRSQKLKNREKGQYFSMIMFKILAWNDSQSQITGFTANFIGRCAFIKTAGVLGNIVK